MACVPLLLAKMYAASPHLFERPLLGSPVRMLDRVSIAVPVAAGAVLPRRLRPPMRVAALAIATVTLIGVPLLMTR